jgi:Flp pilus assembly protein TadD
MSIILDALKKAEDGKKDAEGSPASAVRPPTATPMAARKIGAGPVNKTRAIAMGVAIVALLGFMIFKNAGGGPGGGPFTRIAGLVSGLFHKDQPAVVSTPVPVPAPAAMSQPVAQVPASAQAVVPSAVPAAAPAEPVLSQSGAGQSAAGTTMAVNPKSQELSDSALDNYKNGNFEESAADYEKLIVMDSLNPEVYNNYGVALKKAGKLPKAMANYSKALALKPDYPEALNNLAVAYMADNKYDAAKDLLEKAVVLDPEYIDARLHLAICLEKTGELQEAISYYEAFLKMSEKKVDRRIRLQVEDRLARLKER